MKAQMKLAEKIYSLVQAYNNCQKSGNKEWEDKHEAALKKIEKELLPRGAGFDSGTVIGLCHQEETVFLHTYYHHMNDVGYYDGWSRYTIICKPSFLGINVEVRGENRNDILDYIHDVFYECLVAEYKDE